MNKHLKNIWDKQKKSLQDNINEEIDFFKKPTSLESVINAGLVSLSLLSDQYYKLLKNIEGKDLSKKDISDHVKNSKISNDIISMASSDMDNDVIYLASICESENSIDEISNVEIDFEENITNINVKRQTLEKVKTDKEFIIESLYFINWLIFLIIDSIENSEVPSIYRSKYLKKLARNQSSVIHQYRKKFATKFDELEIAIKDLHKMDVIIATIVSTSYFYLNNRKNIQKTSLDAINELISSKECISTISETIDTSVSTLPLESVNIEDIKVCDVDIDDEETPTIPVTDIEVSCENTIATTDNVISPNFQPITVMKAFIENKTKKEFIIKVGIGSKISMDTVIGNLDSSILYSPLDGQVEKIENNKIYLKDIFDQDETLIEKNTELLVENYKKIYDSIDFLKKYSVLISYPIMLSNSGNLVKDKFIKLRDQHAYYVSIHEKSVENYNKKIQSISKYENVKIELEDDNIDLIKLKIEKETDDLLKNIKTINDRVSDNRYNTIQIPSDYELFDYYISLLTQLNTSLSLTENEKIIRDKIYEFTEYHYVLNKSNESIVKNLINENIKDLERGLSFGNYFDKTYDVYKENRSVKDVEKFIVGIANNNNKMSEFEKDKKVKSILYLFNFWLSTADIIKRSTIKIQPITEKVKIEGDWLKAFLDDTWKKYESVKLENSQIEEKLKQYNVFAENSIIEEKGEKYRSFYITDGKICNSNPDPISSPDSTDDLYTLKYWKKYMSKVSLISAADPLSWSTGLILPSGPTKFPVVYVPVVPIKTVYGLVLIGISICGIYVCPFVVYNNMTSSPKNIKGNIISFRDEINSLKKEINTISSTLKNEIIDLLLEEIKSEIQPIKNSISSLRSVIKKHNESAPSIKEKYKEDLAEWKVKKEKYIEEFNDLNLKKFKLQAKHKVLKDYKSTGKLSTNATDEDKRIKKIESTQKNIKLKLDKLDSLLDKIDDIVSALPSSVEPNSANFGATLKNPKIVVEIESNTNDSINESILNDVTKTYKLSKEDLMKVNINKKTDELKNRYKDISSSINLIVKSEPYPTYDRLSMTNWGFLKFAKTFVEKGSKSFGIPGQLPLP